VSTTTLIHAANARKLFKRTFQGSVNEILTELFQNAQRVGATKVDLVWNELETVGGESVYQFQYQDNGPGLKGIEGFEALLCIALSAYDEDVTSNQQPMGIGFQALLAHEHVSQVVVSSGGYQLTIDTKRWWNDELYAELWPQRLEPSLSPSFGFKALVTRSFAEQLRNALPTREESVNSYIAYPALGFADLLAVHAQGARCVQGLPRALQTCDHLTTLTLADGNELSVYAPKDVSVYGQIFCNWYGQIVSQQFYEGLGGLKALLVVTRGQPVDLVAPSRRAFVENEKLRELKVQVAKAFISYLTQLPRAQVTIALVEFAYRLLADMPEKVEMPYLLLRQLGTDDTRVVVHADECKRYLILNPLTRVVLDDSDDSLTFGLSSFAKALDLRAFTIEAGDPGLVNKRLWWKPGPASEDKRLARIPFKVVGTGHYCLQDNNDCDTPTKWKRVPASATVYVHRRMIYNDFDDADLLVGTKDPTGFLATDATKLLRLESDDRDRERQLALFKQRVTSIERGLMGKSLPREFTYKDLQTLFADQQDPVIVNVRFCFENGDTWPTHATVVPLEGKRVKARLHG
jgi:hypothetical protein